MLNSIAIDLQLYKIFKITRVSFFGTQCRIHMAAVEPSLAAGKKWWTITQDTVNDWPSPRRNDIMASILSVKIFTATIYPVAHGYISLWSESLWHNRLEEWRRSKLYLSLLRCSQNLALAAYSTTRRGRSQRQGVGKHDKRSRWYTRSSTAAEKPCDA